MNVLVDLGGVVVTWQPDRLIAEQFEDPLLQRHVKTGFVAHPDWVDMDRGTLSADVAVARGSQRTGVPETQLLQFLHAVPAALKLIPETVDLLYRLQAQGHTLFCLSNMHPAFIAHLESTYNFWPVFTDAVISCRVQLCKPEPEIFQHVLSKHALNPRDTLFIDDTAVNLTAAAEQGIQTLLFENPEQCAADLLALGYLA